MLGKEEKSDIPDACERGSHLGTEMQCSAGCLHTHRQPFALSASLHQHTYLMAAPALSSNVTKTSFQTGSVKEVKTKLHCSCM